MTEIARRTVWGGCGGDATSAERGLAILALGAMLCVALASAANAAAPANQEKRSALAHFKNAATAGRENLRTGRAEGSFRIWGADSKLMQSARFTAAFDGSKHYLKLVYAPTAHSGVLIEYDRRILVCDGSELFVSRFSEHIHPVGAEADVLEGGAQYSHFAAAGFPASLKTLVSGILSPEALDKYAVELEPLATGHFRGEFQVTRDYHVTFEVAPEYAYHCVLSENFGGTQLASRWTVTWERAKDLWYVAGGKMERYEDAKHDETKEWQLDEFEANVPVAPELFTLSALELPRGARILDRRRPKGLPLVNDAGEPIPYRPKIYRLPYGDGKIDKKMGGRLIEQIEALPPK